MEPTNENLEKNTRLIADPIHGMIRVDGLITYLIDRPEFQRLRNIQQLGLCSFVYPTACHNRFQHSLGTYHMARTWLDSLRTQDIFTITDREAMCVYVAALYHDIGHGPFSHFWDNVFVKRTSELKNVKSTSHEKMGTLIFKKMREEDEFKSKWLDCGMKEEDFEIIEDLINGKYDCKLPPQKRFLTMIVANKQAEIDVDKWDYLMRDSYHTCDTKIDLCVPRFREWLTFKEVDGKPGEWCTAVRDKEFINVAAIFYHRHKMHRQVYQHKTVTAINEMFYDALECVNSEMSLDQNYENDVASFLSLTDHLFWTIANGQFSTEKGKQGQKIVQRILKRDLYKYLATFRVLRKDCSDKKEMLEKIKADLHDKGYDSSKVCVTIAEFSLAGGMKNPLEKLIIVDKKGNKVPVAKISQMIQLESEPEVEFRLYSKCLLEDEDKKNVVNLFNESCGVKCGQLVSPFLQ